MKPTKEQIIAGLISGDKDAFNYLYSYVFYIVLCDVVSNSGTPEDAHDIFQDVIFDFYLKARKNKLIIEKSFESYLITACHYKWLSEVKKRKRMILDNNIDPVEKDESFDEEIIRECDEKLKFSLVDRYMNSLSEICRQIVNLMRCNTDSNEIMYRLGYKCQSDLSKKRYDCLKMLCKRIKNDSKYNEIMN